MQFFKSSLESIKQVFYKNKYLKNDIYKGKYPENEKLNSVRMREVYAEILEQDTVRILEKIYKSENRNDYSKRKSHTELSQEEVETLESFMFLQLEKLIWSKFRILEEQIPKYVYFRKNYQKKENK